MAQTTILAAGTTAATSTDIVVAAGDTATVGIFAASSERLPSDVRFSIMLDTPSTDIQVAALSDVEPVQVISGPGTFRVTRPAYTGEAYGVFTEA